MSALTEAQVFYVLAQKEFSESQLDRQEVDFINIDACEDNIGRQAGRLCPKN